MQPLIVNALGPVANVSGAVAPTVERPDRIPPAVSISSLVSLASLLHKTVDALFLNKFLRVVIVGYYGQQQAC